MWSMNNSDPVSVTEKPKKSTAHSHGLNDFSHTLPIRLLRARQAAVNQFQPIFRQYNVTEQQWRVLRMVTSAGSMTAGELSKSIFVSMPSLSRIMQSLEKRHLIRRRSDRGDLRKTMISPTPAGQAMVAEAAIWSDTRYREIAEWFGRDRLQELQLLLDDLVQTLDQHR
jgi:homoprotocatechuate degradation regulator HpaR